MSSAESFSPKLPLDSPSKYHSGASGEMTGGAALGMGAHQSLQRNFRHCRVAAALVLCAAASAYGLLIVWFVLLKEFERLYPVHVWPRRQKSLPDRRYAIFKTQIYTIRSPGRRELPVGNSTLWFVARDRNKHLAGFHLHSLSADLLLVNRERTSAPGRFQKAWRVVLRKNDAPS